jgi:hypothetical protein
MAAKKTAKATKSKAKKAAAPKKAPAKKAVKADKSEIDLSTLDRKSLAAQAKQVKKELLAIRFNLQAPSLKEYRRKKAELQKYLAQLN